MLITIALNDSFLSASDDKPEVGRTYALEPADEGTAAQGRAFHALVQEYWRSGCASYPSKGFNDFRNKIKMHLGAGFEAYVYAVVENGRAVIKDAKTWADIPEDIRNDPAKREYVRGRLKSWADYTKKERKETIANLIREMMEAGVNSTKFNEILKGLEDGKHTPSPAR